MINVEAAERIVIRFSNQMGALVTVTELPPPKFADPDAERGHQGRCSGCLDASQAYTATYPDHLGNARTWANKHAAACRALPQPDQEH